MIIRENRLIAETGMRLINVDSSIALEVWLSPSDSIANWREITEAEALAIEEEIMKAREDETEEQD